MRVKNAIPLIACTVGSHASAPRNDQEQKHGGSAIVKTGVVPTTLTLYRLEKACQGSQPEDVYRRRQSESLPLMEEVGEWLSKTEVLPKGYLGKAIGYCQKQWPKLMRYLEDGRLSIDNNRAARAIKPFVIGRKNWLFANTEAGAHASALLYSLVETARINGLTPYAYLLALLTALKSPDADIDWDGLLPWNITLP